MNRARNIVLLALVALLVLPAFASAARSTGAVVFSRVTATTTEPKEEKGGLFAVRDGRLNQLTENSAPTVSPNGRYVVFERRTSATGPADLYTVGAKGGGVRPLVATVNDEHDASIAPDGRGIVFVSTAPAAGGGSDDLYSVRPNGGSLVRLTATGIDEFSPRYFAGGIVYSRGESTEGPAAYADVFTMRGNGSRAKPLVSGVGSAYVEDVSPAGHTVIFRRDRGLWVKRIGKGRARKLTELPDGSKTNSVFSSDSKRVAAIVQVEGETQLVAIDVKSGRRTNLASGADLAEGGSEIGPVISWQPVPGR